MHLNRTSIRVSNGRRIDLYIFLFIVAYNIEKRVGTLVIV